MSKSTVDCLKTRRSVRSYKPDPIPKEILRQVFETASYAPSAKNTQPWEYYLLTGKEKSHICDIVVEEHPKRGKPFRKRKEYAPIRSTTKATSENVDDFRTTKVMTNIGSTVFIREAPVLVLVFNKAPWTGGEENVIKEIDKEALLAHTIETQSVSSFILSVLLAAHDLGLGGCWIGDINFCRYKIKEYIGTESDLIAGIVLGYPEKEAPPKKIAFETSKIDFWREKKADRKSD